MDVIKAWFALIFASWTTKMLQSRKYMITIGTDLYYQN